LHCSPLRPLPSGRFHWCRQHLVNALGACRGGPAADAVPDLLTVSQKWSAVCMTPPRWRVAPIDGCPCLAGCHSPTAERILRADMDGAQPFLELDFSKDQLLQDRSWATIPGL
jgi:hypothetical protein